jgi:hypothetical protein
MNELEFLGDFIEVSGKLLVAWTAIAVHHRVKNEHKIDEKVFKIMQRETRLGIFGIVMIVVGFGIRSYARHIL